MDGYECNYAKKRRNTLPTQVGIPFWKCPMKEKLLGKVPYNYTININASLYEHATSKSKGFKFKIIPIFMSDVDLKPS
jgi:hypothetical protein